MFYNVAMSRQSVVDKQGPMVKLLSLVSVFQARMFAWFEKNKRCILNGALLRNRAGDAFNHAHWWHANSLRRTVHCVRHGVLPIGQIGAVRVIDADELLVGGRFFPRARNQSFLPILLFLLVLAMNPHDCSFC